MALPALIPFINPILGIIDKFVPDKQKQLEIKTELMTAALNAESELYKQRGGIITAEAQGESWMQRNWRPITMLTFVFIIANNYVFVPYFTWFSEILFARGSIDSVVTIPILEIPEGMWSLLTIGIGGYIASRGIEKTVAEQQKGGVPLIGASAKNMVTRQDLDDDREKLLQQLKGL